MALVYEDHLPLLGGLLRVVTANDLTTPAGTTIPAGTAGVLHDRASGTTSIVAFDPAPGVAGVVLVVRDEDLDAVESGS